MAAGGLHGGSRAAAAGVSSQAAVGSTRAACGGGRESGGGSPRQAPTRPPAGCRLTERRPVGRTRLNAAAKGGGAAVCPFRLTCEPARGCANL